ncbi:hypothetical protein DV735_g2376, partial [Chaetothyriales sp. CBS 134920]
MGAGASRPAARARGLIVSFDALGTLYRLRKPVGEQYLAIAQQCGLNRAKGIDAKDVEASFRTAFKAVSARHPNYGRETLASPEEWWAHVLSSRLYQHFSSQAAYELYPDVRPFLQRVHEIRQRLEDERSAPDAVLLVGVITNSDPRVRQVLESMGLAVGVSRAPERRSMDERWREASETARDPEALPIATSFRYIWSARHHFDFVSTSYEAEAEKPEPAIFNRAGNLARLNLISRMEQRRHSDGDRDHPFREAFDFVRDTISHRRDIETMAWIHVGDDYAKDYVGAHESGIEAFHLVRQGDGGARRKGAQTISNLIELVPIVNIMAEQNLFSKGQG